MGVEGLDSLAKPEGGVGLQRYWKDLFPDRLTKLYVYKSVNQLHRGKTIFSREDDISIISLQLVDTVEGIFGGEAYTTGPLTVEEDKTIKELELNNIPSKAFTAFLNDLKHDYKDQNLFFTIDEPFVQGDINIENMNVFVAVNTNPNVFAKQLQGISSDVLRGKVEQGDLNKTTISYTLSPAILQNNLQSSKVAFADATNFKQMPIDKKGFNITSIDIEADPSFSPEFGNWFHVKGKREYGHLVLEDDLDYKSDKPFLPLQIAPYAKYNKVQFAIKNFNKYSMMPWVHAKKFLSTNRSISNYIHDNSKEQWKIDLSTAVKDMFKMSRAFTTGFSEYRDGSTGELLNEKIGGVAIKSLERKDQWQSTSQVLWNWIESNPEKLKTPEFIRATQLIAASSHYIASKWGYSKELTEGHKTLMDWFVVLDTPVKKDTGEIYLTLHSLFYDFDSTDPANPTLTLKEDISESLVDIFETDRYSSIPELDDPISISTFTSHPSDIDLTKIDSFKYYIGVDVTDSKKIQQMFVDSESSNEEIETVDVVVDTGYIIAKSVSYRDYGQGQTLTKHNAISTQTSSGHKVYPILGDMKNSDEFNANFDMSFDINLLSAEQWRGILNIPKNAFDIVYKNKGTSINEPLQDAKQVYGARSRSKLSVTATRLEGVVVSYKIRKVLHSIDNRAFTYDKSRFIQMLASYRNGDTIKRRMTLSDIYKDNVPKILDITRIYLSSFLGEWIDITYNYEYEDDAGNKQTGSSRLPRLTLPALHDERRTKFGVRN